MSWSTITSGVALVTVVALGSANIMAADSLQLAGKIAEYGVLGIAVAALSWAVVKKDKQVNALYVRLVEKSEQDARKYHELSEALNGTLRELLDLHK